ncbi:MAG: hypothetical protein NC182_06380 [Prevotella sp.]|nr:hypothetical protein [Staphylococcus sp.]MCM1350812.1 hypothetical protein [Prevotella sp.]
MDKQQLQKISGILLFIKSIVLLVGAIVLLFSGIGLITGSAVTPDPNQPVGEIGAGIAEGCAKVIGVFSLIAFGIVLIIGLVYLLLSKNLVFKKIYPKTSAIALFVLEIVTLCVAVIYMLVSLIQHQSTIIILMCASAILLSAINIVLLSLLFHKVKQ